MPSPFAAVVQGVAADQLARSFLLCGAVQQQQPSTTQDAQSEAMLECFRERADPDPVGFIRAGIMEICFDLDASVPDTVVRRICVLKHLKQHLHSINNLQFLSTSSCHAVEPMTVLTALVLCDSAARHPVTDDVLFQIATHVMFFTKARVLPMSTRQHFMMELSVYINTVGRCHQQERPVVAATVLALILHSNMPPGKNTKLCHDLAIVCASTHAKTQRELVDLASPCFRRPTCCSPEDLHAKVKKNITLPHQISGAEYLAARETRDDTRTSSFRPLVLSYGCSIFFSWLRGEFIMEKTSAISKEETYLRTRATLLLDQAGSGKSRIIWLLLDNKGQLCIWGVEEKSACCICLMLVVF